VAALLALTTVCALAAVMIGVQASSDVSELRDNDAVWNVARPVIEESIGGVAVSSAATWLLVLISGAAALAVRPRGLGADLRLISLAGYALVATAALLWIDGGLRAGGLGRTLDDVNAVEALDVFENYTQYIDGWRTQTVGHATTAVGAALLGIGCWLGLADDRRSLDSGPPLPTTTEDAEITEVD